MALPQACAEYRYQLLPYISYGGTALLLQLCEMGIVLNISRQIPGRRVRIGDSSQKSEHEEHRQIHAALNHIQYFDVSAKKMNFAETVFL